MHEVVYWKVVVHRIFLVFLKTVITEFRYVFKSVANLLKLCNKEKKKTRRLHFPEINVFLIMSF